LLDSIIVGQAKGCDYLFAIAVDLNYNSMFLLDSCSRADPGIHNLFVFG